MDRQTLSVDVATLVIAKKIILQKLSEFKKLNNIPNGLGTNLDAGVAYALSVLDEELESYGIRKEVA